MMVPKSNISQKQLKTGAFVALVVTALSASQAAANPGAAMVMVVAFHFFVGNFLIGVVEWIGLGLLGGAWKRGWLMIPANYISAWFGLYLMSISGITDLVIGDDVLDRVVWASWVMLILFTLAGIIIELPIIWFTFKKPRSPKRILLSAILIHVVTGAGVGVWYANSSNLSLASDFRMVSIEQYELGADLDQYWVYYHDTDDMTHHRMRLDGSQNEPVGSFPATPASEQSEQDQSIFDNQTIDLRIPDQQEPEIESSTFSPFRPITLTWSDGTEEHLGLINMVVGTSATPSSVTVLPGITLYSCSEVSKEKAQEVSTSLRWNHERSHKSAMG